MVNMKNTKLTFIGKLHMTTSKIKCDLLNGNVVATFLTLS